MSAVLRPYKDLFPKQGDRVMIDASSVVIGDVRMADDVSIWPSLPSGETLTMCRLARAPIFRTVAFCMSRTNPPITRRQSLIIGEDVTVGHKVMLHGCTIGNRVLVGMGRFYWMAS
jgi:carbonic anhydrase/acetyltransferase-like protein (isoleucine patch superfamily)